MKQQIKIAIFGLSLNVLENIKYKISRMCNDLFNISWVNIGDPQLEILLVNDMFFGSPTIQNLVSANKVPYLRLMSAKQGLSNSIVNDTMYLPFEENEQALNWFKERYAKIPLQYNSQQKIVEKKFDISKVLNELLNERNGNLQVFDRNGPIALINIRTEQVWLDPTRKNQMTDESLNYTYATMQMIQNISLKQGGDLRSWIWNLMWDSESLVGKVSPQKYYKLQYWPYCNPSSSRAQIFKIAACFELGSNIHRIEKKLEVDSDLINKFVSIGLMTHVLREIPDTEATFFNEESVKKENVIKGFFGKLRKKLGI